MRDQKKIIISRLFASDQKLASHLFETPRSVQLRAAPRVVLSESWELRQEQRILLRAALDIWSGDGNVFLWELLNDLGHRNLSKIIGALQSLRDMKAELSEEC